MKSSNLKSLIYRNTWITWGMVEGYFAHQWCRYVFFAESLNRQCPVLRRKMIVFTDFDFVEKLYLGGLAARADQSAASDLSIPEQNVLLTWWAKGQIDNGGFASLYASPVHINDVEHAFRGVGLDGAADACRRSKAVFMDGSPPEDQAARVAIVEEIHDPVQGKDPWRQCDEIIWNLGNGFDAKVAGYIRANSQFFADLQPKAMH